MKKIIIWAALIGAGYYIYSGNFSQSDRDSTVKKLFDKVASTPVSAQEVKPVFKDDMIHVCEVNGVDTINGLGTTTECINNFEMLASEYCFEQLSDFEGKTYTSKRALMDDLIEFSTCSMNIVMGAYRQGISK